MLPALQRLGTIHLCNPALSKRHSIQLQMDELINGSWKNLNKGAYQIEISSVTVTQQHQIQWISDTQIQTSKLE